MAEHRASERSLYDRLQQPDLAKARDLIELLLSNSSLTYEEICKRVNGSGLCVYRTDAGARAALPALTPQALTRYRQRKAKVESRAEVLALIESDSDALLAAAAKNPSGVIAGYLRKSLAEEAVRRFDTEARDIGVVDLSREAARHALVEQRDRKLDLDAEKIGIDRKRIELQEKQAELQRDRLAIAADTWRMTLAWFVREEPDIADRLARRSDEFLIALEESMAAE